MFDNEAVKYYHVPLAHNIFKVSELPPYTPTLILSPSENPPGFPDRERYRGGAFPYRGF